MVKIYTCKIHASLEQKDIIKAGKKRNGDVRYRCRFCMKQLHQKNYEKNKEILKIKHAEYRKENKEILNAKKREIAKLSRHKDKENKRIRNVRYRKKHREVLNKKHVARKKMYMDTLHDSYVKRLLVRRSNLKAKDVDKSLIELKRAIVAVRRKIKEKKLIKIMGNCHEIEEG